MQSPQFGQHHSHPFPVTPSKRTVDWADLVSDDSSAEADICDVESCPETGSTHAASCPASPSGSSSAPSVWSHSSSTVTDMKGSASLPGMAQSLVKQLKAFEALASEAAVDQDNTQIVKTDCECNTTLLGCRVENTNSAVAKLSEAQSQVSELQASVIAASQQAAELEAKRDAAIAQVQALSAEAQESDAGATKIMGEVVELKVRLEEVRKRLQSSEACIAKQSAAAGTQDRETKLRKLRENALSAKRATEEFQVASANAHAATLAMKQRRKCRSLRSEEVAPDADDATNQVGANISALQQQVQELRAELDAPTAAELRVNILQKRIGQLGIQNEALKASLESESAMDEVELIPNKMQDDASTARNRDLLAKVQKLRTLRDNDQTIVETLRNEVVAQKAMCANEQREIESLALQVRQACADKDIAQQEMYDEAAQVERLEQQVHEASEYVTRVSSQHRTTSIEIEASRKAQKQAECKETILEWKLKKALLQLQQQPHISSAARKLGRHLVKPLGTLSSATLKAKIAAKIPETGEDSDAASSCCTSTTCEPQSEGGILN